MREEKEVIKTKLQLIHNQTGELIEVDGESEVTKRYYSIKKLNKRICVMDLFTYQSKLCKSSKDITMFRDFLLAIDKYNEFRKVIVDFCKENNIDRSRFTKFIKKSIEIGFIIRIDRGVYIVNPYAFQSIGSNNQLIEDAQSRWKKLI